MRKAFVLVIILALLVTITGCFWDHMESNTAEILQNVWGSNDGDMFAVGGFLSGFITHFDGTDWSEMTVPTPTIPAAVWGFTDVWGTGPNDVFAVGGAEPDRRGIVYHYDGTSWSDMGGDHPKLLRSVWGTATDNVFAVGGAEDIGLIIEHYNGSTWTIMESYPNFPIYAGFSAVWGDSASDVWAVGDNALIFHYDGDSWNWIYPPPIQVSLYGVHGLSSTNVFAVGEGGTIIQYDGSSWSQVDSGTTKTLSDVTRYWAVGEGGTILLYSNGEWGPYLTPTTEHLFGVWRQSPGTGYACAVGNRGVIVDFPNDLTTSQSEGMGMELGSSALLASNSILSVDTATLGDHVAITVEVMTDHPLTVEDSLPNELSYIPDTLVVSGGPFTCETSEHEIACKLKEAGSYVITFDVQVTRSSGFMGMGGFTWPLPSPDDLEGEEISVENTVRIGHESITETLTITPFEGFNKLYAIAWYWDEDGVYVDIDDPLNVPTGTDVHWDIYLVVYNPPGDAISEMSGVKIGDMLGNDLELDDTVMIRWDGDGLHYDHDTDPVQGSGKAQKVNLRWKDVPLLADGHGVAPKLEISTDVNHKGKQEFADGVLTEHELNSGAVLKFIDPETGLHLRADTPPIMVMADPDWGEE